MNKHTYTEPMLYCARCAEYKFISEVHIISISSKPRNPERETIVFICPDCGSQDQGSKIR